MKQIGKITLCFLVYVLISATLIEPISNGHYAGIRSEGDLPSDFLVDLSKRGGGVQALGNSRNLSKKDIEEYWLKNRLFINQVMTEGDIRFGDELSEYLNYIKDHLLRKNEKLQKEIRVYTSVDPNVNAFANQLGVVVMHVGLIARAKSEADKAFVIAHEIAHITEKHGLKREDLAAELDKRKNNSMWRYEKLDVLTDRSQDQELEADKVGYNLMKQSSYSLDAVSSAFDILSREYLPIEQLEID